MTDVPTLTSATAANYCVINPLIGASTATISNGNLTITKTSAADVVMVGTTAPVNSGKYYWEATLTTVQSSSNVYLGVVKAPQTTTSAWVASFANGVGWQGGTTGKIYTTTVSAGTANYSSGQVCGLALDMGAGTLSLYINNSLIGTISGVTTSIPHYPMWDGYGNSEVVNFNFGQQPFTYTPPSGFVALNTFNL
mgnify:CR=1 FL=1